MTTKSISLIVTAWCVSACAAAAQVSLYAGEVFSHEFNMLPRVGGQASGSEFATFAFQVTHPAGQAGGTVLYEMFEGGASGVPLCSGTLSAPSYVAACTVPGAWLDLQGTVRFKVLSGAMRIDHVLFRVEKREGSAFGVHFAEMDLAAEPRLTIAHTGVAQVQITWLTNFGAYDLEGATSLAAPQWTAVTNSVTVAGRSNSVTLERALPQRMFRLRRR